MASPLPTEQEPLSVYDLTMGIKELVETRCSGVSVWGEISNFSRPSSGHCYFTLKDERAQIRAVMWRSVAERVRFALEDGLEVNCLGDVEVYPPRGQYQIVVRRIEPRGLGALELALRRLREKLAAEGLFEPGRKRRLPMFPRRVAFVTSPTGAAVRDFLQVVERRWRATDVLIVPTKVQGDGAAEEIARGIAAVNRLSVPIDVIIVGRGGGSLEDLWSFNEEVVCRAIHASRIPVISAVGHEIDVTLSDLVADVRALTPSEAGERVVPDQAEVLAYLRAQQQRLVQALRGRAQLARRQLDQLASRRVMRKPFDLVHDLTQRLDELSTRGTRALRQRLRLATRQLDGKAAQLEALSPLGILARGYSVTTADHDRLVRNAGELQVGQTITTRVQHGKIVSRVEAIEPSEDRAADA